jgi:hypothetical protein
MLTAWVLCGIVVAQSVGKPLHADRVVLLKKERTLQLLSEGKIVKSYKVSLGGDPVEPKTRQGTTRLRRASTFSIRGMRTVNFTSRFTFRIRTRGIVRRRGRKAFLREVCPRVAQRVQVGRCLSPGEGLDGMDALL